MKTLTKKKVSGYRPRIRSRHPSHNALRILLPRMPFDSIVRLGSITGYDEKITECNTVQAITNSAHKGNMKKCFVNHNVKCAESNIFINKANLIQFFKDSKSGIIAKSFHGSRNEGNHYITTEAQLNQFLNAYTPGNFIYERYYNYGLEYRLHVTKEGCFYACRKALKKDTPEDKKWFINDSNCVWFLENGNNFLKPNTWTKIVEESVKALNAVGLDVGAVDVKVQTSGKKGKREQQNFIIIEINSAPSFGDITLKKYLEIIPKILNSKNK